MPVKRNVSSAWEVSAAPPPSSAVKRPKCLKPSLAESTEQVRPLPRVLTLTSPIQESNFHTIGGFLENCYNCKKKISQNDDVFMYSDLRAFCTVGCRDSQIALDKEMEKQAATSKVVTQAQRVNNVRG